MTIYVREDQWTDTWLEIQSILFYVSGQWNILSYVSSTKTIQFNVYGEYEQYVHQISDNVKAILRNVRGIITKHFVEVEVSVQIDLLGHIHCLF